MSPPHILLEEDYRKPLHALPVNFDYTQALESKFFYKNHSAKNNYSGSISSSSGNKPLADFLKSTE